VVFVWSCGCHGGGSGFEGEVLPCEIWAGGGGGGHFDELMGIGGGDMLKERGICIYEMFG
jgi:hypothetical protein